ncbi:MAG: glycosyltransferase, partial [Promethearchaeota archaeon]
VDDFIITYVGHMVFEQKVRGMVDFLEAFNKFLSELEDEEQRKKFKLIIIGDGPFKYLLDRAHEASEYKDQVILTGLRLDVPDFFAVSDLSALVSYVEGFPNVLLESMIAAVPCIASNVGDVQEIIGKAGFVVKSGDIEAMKKALRTYFADPGLREQLKKASFKRVKENYDWRQIAERVRDLYKELSN